MSVITNDILIESQSRDEVLAWLGRPENHRILLEGAFEDVKELAPGDYTAVVRAPIRPKELTYTFDRVDEEHGGRRVHVKLGGRRTRGVLHYSLRTTKPSTDTLVTLHMDFKPGEPVIGMIAELAGLRDRLDASTRRMLENLKAALKA